MYKNAETPKTAEEAKVLIREIAEAFPFWRVGMSHGDWLRRIENSGEKSLILINRLSQLYKWAGVSASNNFGYEPNEGL